MEIQLSILEFFQSIKNPILDVIFLILTISTELPVIIIFTSYMYWCLNKGYGQRILFSLVSNVVINTGTKEFFKSPRPIGVEGIDSMRVETATGYSFPSGHTQMATTFWTSLIKIFKNKYVTIIGIIVILGVGVSRLYLGVHWPIDVIFGWIFGYVFTVLFLKLFDYVDKSKNYLALVYMLIPFVLAIFIVNTAKYTKIFGLLLGFVIGYIVEDKFIKFKTDYKLNNKYYFNKSYENTNRIKRNLKRFLLGIISLGALYGVLKLIMPEFYIFDCIRYVLVAFYGVAGVPYMFKRFNVN